MSDDLRRLLQSHKFLDLALQSHGRDMSPADADKLVRERERVFLRLIEFVSDNPRVTQAQIEFLVSALTAMASDTAVAELLRKSCQDAVGRLASQVEKAKAPPHGVAARGAPDGNRALAIDRHRVGPDEARLLDSLPDRCAVCSPDYRYLYTNPANARFYDRPAATFVDQPIWTVVGERCFQSVTKPILDMAYAGIASNQVGALQHAGRNYTYAITCDPIRNDAGNITAALIVARDVTRFDAEPSIEVPAPDK